jgi:hypothetical protein
MRKKVNGEVACGGILAEKGRNWVLPPEIHDSDRTCGLARDGQSEGGKRQWGGSRAEPQVEIVKCFDGL